MLPFKLPAHRGLRILCLGAHCDDIEIGVGGTILRLQEEYPIEIVEWVVLASNDVRKLEAENSARQFLNKTALRKIEVNSFRDGFLPFQAEAIKEYFEELKKRFVPDLIFTHYRDDRHQDHRLVSDLTWNTWRNNLILEYEIPKYDGDLGKPNFYISLDASILEKRNQILLEAFVSQQSKHWFDRDTFNALPRLRGMESANQFAEAFYARKITL